VRASTTRVQKKRPTAEVTIRSGSAFATLLTGQGAGVVVALDTARVVLGRGENADLRLLGDTISRNHAQFALDPEGFVKIVDIHSRNGTYVNGVMVRSEVLRDGDRVSLGADALLEVRYGYGDEGEPANAGEPNPFRRGEAPPLKMHALASGPDARFDHTLEAHRRVDRLRKRRLGVASAALAVVSDAAGMLHLQAGDAPAAVEAHQRALKLYDNAPYITPLERGHTTTRLARALLAAGETEQAQAHLDEADAFFRTGNAQPGERLEFLLAQGELYAATDRARFEVLEVAVRDELAEIGSDRLRALKTTLFRQIWEPLADSAVRRASSL
jgi:tetratricopeptide (TPR) repeat protein